MFFSNNTISFEELVKKFSEVFFDRFYIEIQRHYEDKEKNYENYLLKISSKFDLPLIAGQEVFYIDKDMDEAHDA